MQENPPPALPAPLSNTGGALGKKIFLVIKDMKSQQEVRRIDVTGKNEHARERILYCILTQMDRDRYAVDEIEE